MREIRNLKGEVFYDLADGRSVKMEITFPLIKMNDDENAWDYVGDKSEVIETAIEIHAVNGVFYNITNNLKQEDN